MRLYYSLPKYLRDIESVKTAQSKIEINKFLELIPDKTKMSNNVTAARTNSILDQLSDRRAQGICQGGGIPDSAMEQTQLTASKSLQAFKVRTVHPHRVAGICIVSLLLHGVGVLPGLLLGEEWGLWTAK